EVKSSIELKGKWLLSAHDSIPLNIMFTYNNLAIHSFDTILKNHKTDDTIYIATKFPGTGFLDSSTGTYKLNMMLDPNRKIKETSYTDNDEPCFIIKSCLTFNGHMENGSNDSISGWKIKEDTTGAIFKWEPAGTGVNGSRCISIESTAFNHASWYFETKMEKGKYYRLTGWVKGENVKVREGSTSIPLTIGCRYSIPVRIEQSGTFDWTYFDEIIENETDRDSCFFDCNIGLISSQYYASGKVYYDNLKLQLVE
ncbi:MAG TPA: hypothetical protein VKO63_03480, partial [Chitinispirillaceae bacterium]|nr:hypothetical protein [Chitinispirillaceae bacterium]